MKDVSKIYIILLMIKMFEFVFKIVIITIPTLMDKNKLMFITMLFWNHFTAVYTTLTIKDDVYRDNMSATSTCYRNLNSWRILNIHFSIQQFNMSFLLPKLHSVHVFVESNLSCYLIIYASSDTDRNLVSLI